MSINTCRWWGHQQRRKGVTPTEFYWVGVAVLLQTEHSYGVGFACFYYQNPKGVIFL